MTESAIDPTPNPDLTGALSQISGQAGPMIQRFQGDQAKLEGVNQDLSALPSFEQTPEGQSKPQINPNGVMSTMPYLLGLAALGGKVAGLHPKIMLNATNSMMKGLIQGNQKAYQDAKTKYDEAYQRYLDKYKQQYQIYKEMQQVYKGEVNADLKALEIALRATGYQGKVDAEALKNWHWTMEHTAKLEKQEEDKRHHLATEGKQSGPKVPSGFEPDPDHPGQLMPIKGGPKDPDVGGMGNRMEVFFQRTVMAGNEAAQAAANIMELPIKSSKGIFGTAEPGKGLLESSKNVLANKITSQDVQTYKTMIAGVRRNLAAIESAGLAPSGSLTDQMSAVELQEGDTQITKLRRMAELRQIVEKGLETNLSSPKIPEPQKQLVRDIIDKMKKAIPFTQHDVTLLEQSTNPQATIMDIAKGEGLAPGGAQKSGAEPSIDELLKKYGG